MVKIKWNWKRSTNNQYKAAITASMCNMIMGVTIAWPSPTLTKMSAGETPIALDLDQTSWMVSLLFIGQIISPIPTGYLMDKFGRKKISLVLSILPMSSWLFILLASCPVHLYIARFNAGLWVGIAPTVIPIYVAEIAEPELRKTLATLVNLLYNFGVLLPYLVGPYLSYQNLAIACEILTVAFFFLFLTMPESPYYYLKHDQTEDAFDALFWLRDGYSKESIQNEILRIKQSLHEVKQQKGLKDIFLDRGNRKGFIISNFYSVIKVMVGYSIMQMYASVTLPEATFSTLNPDTCAIIIGIISFMASILSTPLAAIFTRKVLLTVSCIGFGLCTSAISLWFFINQKTNLNVDRYSDIVFISFALYYIFFNTGLGPIGTGLRGEMLSPNVKALTASFITISVAFTVFLLSKFYLIIAQSTGMYVNYLIFSVSGVVTLIFTWVYLPETDNKTLEEIYYILSKEKYENKQYSKT